MLLLKRIEGPARSRCDFRGRSRRRSGHQHRALRIWWTRHWPDIDAEICLAEGGRRALGATEQVRYALIQTAEKLPSGAKLVAKGPRATDRGPCAPTRLCICRMRWRKSRCGIRPCASTTPRATTSRSSPASAVRKMRRSYNALFDPTKSAAAREYLAEHEPGHYSMLHTSISPNIISGGISGQRDSVGGHAPRSTSARCRTRTCRRFSKLMKQGDQRSGGRNGPERVESAPSRGAFVASIGRAFQADRGGISARCTTADHASRR